MTYTELQTAVANYLHRTDLASFLPSFIEYGRIRLFDQLRCPEMLTRAAVTLTAGEGALSQDCVSIKAVLDDTTPLNQVGLDEVKAYSSGVYAVQGLTLLAPGYSSLNVVYWERPLTLVGASGSATRTVLEAYPQLWIQAALVEGFAYLDDTENEDKARTRLEDEITKANARAMRVIYPVPVVRNTFVNVTAGGTGL
jgi:hypothetical protein